MKGFEYDDIGLFTFYREQAQYQQKLQQQKRDKAQRKKHKIEQQQKTKQNKQQQLKNKSTLKNIKQGHYTQCMQKDHQLQAKKYIKQLEESGHNKLIYNHKKRQKRYSNVLECPSKQKLDITAHIMDQLNKNDNKINKQAAQIFINKKDYSKFNYYLLMDKQVIAPKQFCSVQIFEAKSDMNKRQLSQDLLKKKYNNDKVYLPFQKRQRFPKISPQFTNKVIPNMSMPKKQLRHLKVYYNPLDIILNNQKFKLKQLKKIPKYKDDHDLQQSSRTPTQQNSVAQIMKKYRMVK